MKAFKYIWKDGGCINHIFEVAALSHNTVNTHLLMNRSKIYILVIWMLDKKRATFKHRLQFCVLDRFLNGWNEVIAHNYPIFQAERN